MERKLTQYWKSIQRNLYPEFEQDHGTQTPKHAEVMIALDALDFERRIPEYSYCTSKGRPSFSRRPFAKAYVAKAILNLVSTRALIDRLKIDKVLFRLCGFDPCRKLPCEATFSNAFAELSKDNLLEKIHGRLIKENLQGELVFHVSRDSTDIAAREHIPHTDPVKAKRLKGQSRRLHRQQSMTLGQMREDLPKVASLGRKGQHAWKGFKLHIDVSDGGIPLAALLTSAHVHDSQVALPLEELTSQRVQSLYSLMDSAYDAAEI